MKHVCPVCGHEYDCYILDEPGEAHQYVAICDDCDDARAQWEKEENP